VAAPPEAVVGERDGVIIVTPLGALRDPLPVGLVDQLEAAIGDRPVIVDLGQITLVSAAPVVGLAAWVVAARRRPDQCCVVCPRGTARALLHQWRITRCLAVFGSVGDALQARRLGAEGYGPGWHPDPLGRPRSDPGVDCLMAIVEHFEHHNRPADPAETLGPCTPAALSTLRSQGLITNRGDGWAPTMLGLRKAAALRSPHQAGDGPATC
jgi:anti-anti-sigma regulatory factor